MLFRILTIIAIILLTTITIITLLPGTSSFEQWDCTQDMCAQTTITRATTCKGETGIYLEYCRTTRNTTNITIQTDNENFITTKITQEQYNIEEIPVQHRIRDMIVRNNLLYYTTITGELILHNLTTNQETIIKLDKEIADGLLGIALHPNKTNKVYLYLYATDIREVPLDINNETIDPLHNRVSSFIIHNNSLTNQTILLDNIPGNGGHVSGKLLIKNEYLYITTGDSEYQKTNNTQLHEKILETNNLIGKTLRIYLNGTIPQDNPYNNEVYTYGHRNILGIATNPQTNSLFVAEHGPWRHDEINKLTKGHNYGWPAYRCSQEYHNITTNNTAPSYCFDEWTLAPGQITFIKDENHEWYGSAFVTGLRSQLIYRLIFEQDNIVDSQVFYFKKEDHNISPRLRAITYYDGSLYVAGDQEGLIKISP